MILREFEVETVTLREVLGLLHGRGYRAAGHAARAAVLHARAAAGSFDALRADHHDHRRPTRARRQTVVAGALAGHAIAAEDLRQGFCVDAQDHPRLRATAATADALGDQPRPGANNCMAFRL